MIHSGIFASYLALTLLLRQSAMDGCELKIVGFFPIWYFLEQWSLWVQVYVGLKTFFMSLQFFFPVIYPFSFSGNFSLILLQNCFVSFESSSSFVFMLSPLTCCKNFPSLFWKVLSCLHWYSLSIYFLPISFDIFLPIQMSVKFCCIFSVFSFFSLFSCSFSFFIYSSSLISHIAFIFLFRFLRKIPILLLTSFAPA